MIKMKDQLQFIHVSFVLLLFILFAATPVVSALMVKMSVEDLTKEADVIIIGNIKEVESRLNFWRTEVHTYSTVSVEKYIKGIGPGTLTIITEGGNAGDSGVWVEDTPVFTKNENVLVFLKKAGREFSVAGWAQGKYIVENEEVLDRSGEKVSLKDFLRRVEDADTTTGCCHSSGAGKPGGARVWDGYWDCRGSGCLLEINKVRRK